jgi:hypothetical protein
LEAALKEMLDVQRITLVCYRYGLALDTRDWPLFASCFEPDAVATYPGLGDGLTGYEAIEEVARTALTPLTRSQHLLGNVLPVVHGAEADVTCYLQAQHVLDGAEGGALFTVAGCYRDRFVQRDDEWRIARRELEVWWSDGNPGVLGLPG